MARPLGAGDASPAPATDLDNKVKEILGVVGAGAYRSDQARAQASGIAFLAALEWVRGALAAKPRPGRKLFLMAHSMGNELLAHALGLPQAPQRLVFDEIFLCAADAAATKSPPGWINAARRLSCRVHVYHSSNDSVLRVSALVNKQERLGFLGCCGLDPKTTPHMRFIDCTATLDADRDPIEGNSGHYYYRRVPTVRADIAAAMAGCGKPGVTVIRGPVPEKEKPASGSNA